jgi:hypothetical protein
MAAADIKIKAQAKRLLDAGDKRFDGYRTMSTDKLQKLIASAQRGGAGTKGAATKGRANGSKGRARATSAVKGRGTTAAKGRAKTAPAAKSTSRKSSPGKGRATAAKGKASRPSAGAGKGKTAKTQTQRRTSRRSGDVAFSNIDNKAVKWNLPSNVGQTGKRKIVMDALRQFKGNKDKAFNAVKRHAVKWYPNALNSYPNSPDAKHAADRMVRWLVGRVAYDYVMATEQHTPGNRAAYGTSKAEQDVRRREARASKGSTRRSGTRSGSARGTSTSTSTRKRATAQKGTQRRAASKPATRKRATTRSTTRKGRTRKGR